eukprot:352361-Chlamydomonas_euryale.AAC.8
MLAILERGWLVDWSTCVQWAGQARIASLVGKSLASGLQVHTGQHMVGDSGWPMQRLGLGWPTWRWPRGESTANEAWTLVNM